MQQDTSTARGRLPNLDVLRGLAALVVLVGHAYGLGGSRVPLSADSLQDAVLMLSPVGVWLFFVMSGLVIGQPFVRALLRGSPRPATGRYAARRAGRLYPLYVVCFVAVLVTAGAAGMNLGEGFAHLALLHNLVPGRQGAFINVTWTLTLEVLFYAAVPVLAALAARRHRGPIPAGTLARWIAWSGVASVAWMLVAGALPASMPRASLYLRMSLPSMWSAFCPGLLLAVALAAPAEERAGSAVLRAVDRLRAGGRTSATVGFTAAGLAVASFFSQPSWGRTAYLTTYDLGRVCWSVTFGVLVIRAVQATHLPARTPRALEALGAWSYGIYLIHGTVFTILVGHDGGSLIPLAHGGAVAFVVHLAFLAGLTIPLAWLSWRVVEQPAMRWAARVGRAPATAPAPAAAPAPAP